jgi:hypothetical protein
MVIEMGREKEERGWGGGGERTAKREKNIKK